MNIASGLIAKSAAALAVVATATAALALSIGSNHEAGIVKSLNEKLENLGLPKDCRFESNKLEKDCGALTNDVLKAIKFEGKTAEDLTISGIVESKDKLKIRRDGDKDIFPDGIKIIFEVNANSTIKGGGLDIDWKLGTNPEYKIKEGTKIEKAWKDEELAKKINLIYNSTSSECTFGEKINVFGNNNNYTIGAKIKGNESKKINCIKESMGYNQGLMLSVSEENDITLDNTKANGKGIVDKIEKNNDGTRYEIKEHEVDGIKHWFLSKK